MSLRLLPPEDPFEHIHADVRHLALADRATRKAAIFTDRWVDYPAGLTAIARLFELFDMPRAHSSDRGHAFHAMVGAYST